MPLLLCPNDNASMTTISRNGVEFDMCPTCRGVWLDRGELENLMASQGGTAGHSSPSITTPSPRYEEPRRYDRDHDDRYKRRKRDSIFDIFD
jgi:Zn-finger nucleic acid-binding protein